MSFVMTVYQHYSLVLA